MEIIPIFKILVPANDFRALINEQYKERITAGEKYDPRDIRRFNEIDEYTNMFIVHGQFSETFDKERALRIFHAAMSWRKLQKVYDISTNEFPADYFERNVIYFKNHDIYNHPLLHFIASRFTKGQEDNEIVKRFIIYNFERHVRRYPGQRIVILFNLNDAGIRNLDYELIKFIISSIQFYYPGLLAYMLMYKMPFLLNAAWRVIRSWLPPESEQFIKFVDTKSIRQFVQPDQLSLEMGGTDTTEYVYIPDPVNDTIEDSMNANSKKKVTFADAGTLDSPVSASPSTELTLTTDVVPKPDLSPQDDISIRDEQTQSSSVDSSQSVTRKSILQKPIVTNGYSNEEKVYHGLSIKPYDELVFERLGSSPNGTSDSIQTITLINRGDKILTFKIKTTSPDKFRVKPGCSLLHPGATATISVYLLKAYCTPTSNINKEKFLIIWTLVSQEFKQQQLVEFWKTVPSSVLYEHRLKCSFVHKSTSAIAINPSNEINPLRSPETPDPSLIEIHKLLKTSIETEQKNQEKISRQLTEIRYLLIIIFAFFFLILIWDMYKYFFSFTSSSVKSDL